MLFLIHNFPEGMKPIKVAGKLGVKVNSVRKIIWDLKRGYMDFNMNE